MWKNNQVLDIYNHKNPIFEVVGRMDDRYLGNLHPGDRFLCFVVFIFIISASYVTVKDIDNPLTPTLTITGRDCMHVDRKPYLQAG